MLDPATSALLIRSGNEGRVRVPVGSCRRPHRLRFGTGDHDRPVALELLPVAAIDEAPVDCGNGQKLERYGPIRSEEHTSELQSPDHLVCRLLLEKKKKKKKQHTEQHGPTCHY